jgi:hypothetical protein
MSLLGDRSAAFIVRIWRERSEAAATAVEWRGSIECVEGGERVYFRDLEVMGSFLETHLQRIGIDAGQKNGGGSPRTDQTANKRRRR